MTYFVCTNCGFWQRHFETPMSCPVCMDFRHTPPEDRWTFLPADEVARTACTRWSEDERGVMTFVSEPRFGIGPQGYLLRHPEGNILFDHCGWYDDAALEFIAGAGGVKWLSASHPHAYGAMWRLQECFGADVLVNVNDLYWTNAFQVTCPMDEALELAPGLTLHRTGGHFDGHAVLLWVSRAILFAGDMLKLHFDGPGQLEALSAHKAFNRRIPMSHVEIRRYREIIEPLEFGRVYTTFDQAACTASQTLAFFDVLLAREPSMEPVPINSL